jgi:hypothetical protein
MGFVYLSARLGREQRLFGITQHVVVILRRYTSRHRSAHLLCTSLPSHVR